MSLQAERPAARPYVLVVEDDGDTRSAVAESLVEAGLDTTAVADGGTALAEVQRRDPSVIVLDLALPVSRRRQVRGRVSPYPREQGAILVLSGIPNAAETAGRIRADAYMSKPFALGRLVAAVRALLTNTAPR